MGGVSTMRVLNVTFGFGSRDGRRAWASAWADVQG